MTPERKAEVNRRLAEFEGYGDILDDARLLAFCEASDYTADLNALARLEAKLPPHRWSLLMIEANFDAATLHVGGKNWPSEASETEAEARAEAICQYLEQRDEEKISAR